MLDHRFSTHRILDEISPRLMSRQTLRRDLIKAANTSALLDDAAYRIEDEVDEDDGDEALIRIFDRDGEQGAEDLLGFDQDGLEDDAEEEQWDLADDGEPPNRCLMVYTGSFFSSTRSFFEKFQTDTRVAAAARSEGNRRRGGMKTQQSTVKIWKVSAPLHVTLTRWLIRSSALSC